jgi:Fic-DOC domain mobile mystery protein B
MDPDVDPWRPIAGETPIDLSGLRDRTIRTRRDLTRAEARNIRKAFVKYLAATPSIRIAPFNYQWFLRLHGEMFGHVWQWAGQLRRTNRNLGVPWAQVAEQLAALAQDLPHWHALPLVEQAARLHYCAVWVHPFLNGNGRWARLLANIWLRQHHAPLVIWPAGIGDTSPIRDDYLTSLCAADAGDLGPLVALHAAYANG